MGDIVIVLPIPFFTDKNLVDATLWFSLNLSYFSWRNLIGGYLVYLKCVDC
jgi:hypothetical protein